MKVKFILLLLFISVIPFLFVSCSKSKDEPEPEPIPWPYLTLDKREFVIDSNAQTLIVSGKTNMREVRVETSIGCDWVVYKEIVRQAGSEDVEFVFDVKENDSGADRVEYVAFTSPLDNGTENQQRIIEPGLVQITQSEPVP